MYKIKKRRLKLEDFLELKKYKPFKKWRQDSKGVNFGAIFGAIGSTLSEQMKAAGFSEEDVDEAIHTFSLENVLKSSVSQGKAKKKGEKALRYAVVGDKLRELFFNLYPGLLERIEREQNFAIKNYYVRTWTGPVRHFPELKYMKFNSRGNLIGVDAILSSKVFASIKNKACNTTIQTAEVYWAMPNATAFNHYMKKWKLKSRIFNYTHDSYEIYVYKTELEIVKGLLKRLVDINRQPYYGIPMDMEIEVSDLTKGQYLKKGTSMNLNDAKLPEEYEKDFDPKIIPIYGEVK